MDEFSSDGIKRESRFDRIRDHEPTEATVQRSNEVFTEEALRSQDGKVVPLTLENGGPVIGEATLKYDPDEKALKAEFRVDDPLVAGFLKGTMPDIMGWTG